MLWISNNNKYFTTVNSYKSDLENSKLLMTDFIWRASTSEKEKEETFKITVIDNES